MSDFGPLNRWANLLPRPADRRYAFAYIAWRKGGCVGIEPERPKALTMLRALSIAEAINLNPIWKELIDA